MMNDIIHAVNKVILVMVLFLYEWEVQLVHDDVTDTAIYNMCVMSITYQLVLIAVFTHLNKHQVFSNSHIYFNF